MHVWGRSIDDLHVFAEDWDKQYFLSLFERHLSPRTIKSDGGVPYRKLIGQVELVSFAVLDNHFHLILHQIEAGGVVSLMRSVLTAYGHRFNSFHGRRAQIFESPYSVRMIEDPADLRQMVTYVHGQHERLALDYAFTSHRAFLGEETFDWLRTDRGVAAFGGREIYADVIGKEVAAVISKKALRRADTPLPFKAPLRRGRGGHVAKHPQ